MQKSNPIESQWGPVIAHFTPEEPSKNTAMGSLAMREQWVSVALPIRREAAILHGLSALSVNAALWAPESVPIITDDAIDALKAANRLDAAAYYWNEIFRGISGIMLLRATEGIFSPAETPSP